MEKTLVLIKPDAVRKKLVGTLLGIYEAHGLVISGMYMTTADEEILSKHYKAHEGQPFYLPLMEFMQSGPIVALQLAGENAVAVVREINGATNPANARPCTIRYLYGTSVQQNAVHGSASVEEAELENAIWFPELT